MNLNYDTLVFLYFCYDKRISYVHKFKFNLLCDVPFSGGFIKLLLDKFAPKKDKNYTNLMEAALLLSYSFLVLIVNFIILMLIHRLPIDIITIDSIGADIFDIEGFGFIYICSAKFYYLPKFDAYVSELLRGHTAY